MWSGLTYQTGPDRSYRAHSGTLRRYSSLIAPTLQQVSRSKAGPASWVMIPAKVLRCPHGEILALAAERKQLAGVNNFPGGRQHVGVSTRSVR
jgi:hypothetical protein